MCCLQSFPAYCSTSAAAPIESKSLAPPRDMCWLSQLIPCRKPTKTKAKAGANNSGSPRSVRLPLYPNPIAFTVLRQRAVIQKRDSQISIFPTASLTIQKWETGNV